MVQLTESSPTAAGHLVAALRRVRVATGVAAFLIRLPPEVAPRIVATTGSALGRLRDQAMARQLLGALRLVAKGRDIARLERLAVQWERDEAPLVGRARRSLDRGRMRRLLLELWRVVRRPAVLPFGRWAIEEVRRTLADPAWKAVLDHPAWDRSPPSLVTLPKEAHKEYHDLRIRIKELRDTIDLVADDRGAAAPLLGRLDRLAATLGDWRDLVKLRRRLVGAGTARALVDARLTLLDRRWTAVRAEWLRAAAEWGQQIRGS